LYFIALGESKLQTMSWQSVNSIITVFKALWSTINEIANFCWSEITLLGLSRRASLNLWLIYWNEVFFFLLNCLPSTHFITTYMRCFWILAFCLAMLKVVRLCLFCANGLLSLDSVILEIYSCVAFWSLSLSLSLRCSYSCYEMTLISVLCLHFQKVCYSCSQSISEDSIAPNLCK
jgi:hypothetical protein